MIRAYSDAAIVDRHAGAGYVILASSGRIIDSAGNYLGSGYEDSTRAELEALLILLYRLETVEFHSCLIHLDSAPALAILERPPEPPYSEILRAIKQAISRLPGRVEFVRIPRAQNLEANRLAQRAARKDSWRREEKPPPRAFLVKVERDWLSEFEQIESFSDKFRYRHKRIPNLYIRSQVDLAKSVGSEVFMLVTARIARDPRVTSRRYQDGWSLQIKPAAGRDAPRATVPQIISSLEKA